MMIQNIFMYIDSIICGALVLMFQSSSQVFTFEVRIFMTFYISWCYVIVVKQEVIELPFVDVYQNLLVLCCVFALYFTLTSIRLSEQDSRPYR